MTMMDIFRAARLLKEKGVKAEYRDELLGTVKRTARNQLETESVELLQYEPNVAVTFKSTRRVPVNNVRKAVEELREKYKQMRPAIANALCDYYESQDIWFRLQLKHVFIDMPDDEYGPRIELSYAPDWDPQHQLVVDLENWTPVNARMI
jgi:hypothetical protein